MSIPHTQHTQADGEIASQRAVAETLPDGRRADAQGVQAKAINGSPRAVAQRAWNAQIHRSPYMAVQRALIAGFGAAQRVEDDESAQGKLLPVQREEGDETMQGMFISYGNAPVQRTLVQHTVGGTAYEFDRDANRFVDFVTLQNGAAGPALVPQATATIATGSGSRATDFAAANTAAGLAATPAGYTWHHHANAGQMELIDSAVHAAFGHTGGFAMWGH